MRKLLLSVLLQKEEVRRSRISALSSRLTLEGSVIFDILLAAHAHPYSGPTYR